jgi:hypothetical protein
MAKMRGVAPFPALWERRTTLEAEDGTSYELLALPDLVAAKKTQQDKDWPMIRRLIEADFAATPAPTPEQVSFWLAEARTPALIAELASRFPVECAASSVGRPLLRAAAEHRLEEVETALSAEESVERAADRAYWEPLRRELEILRRRT